ncbi:ATP-binding cassette domain-containing protein [Ornithinimicrobium pratense]|uniref:ABC transporter ATP-binding protein n=1 Tax=Ornithinimicrobium pratense TaxID=2593973 RepID=A0A5J6V8R8_9MICO|nr:ATP-binding cassette domain-containing protein [Ornithinimicrobium pratense]QFG69493.1 ABC transporter ATP-binding protein [Ornithinimicrobium pratense]
MTATGQEVPLLSARGLVKEFVTRSLLGLRKGAVTAVDHVDLDLYAGQTYGLVGESGSGKSTTGRLLQGLITPTDGTISLGGETLDTTHKDAWKLRREIQMIFQDPHSSLNPRRRVGAILTEAMLIVGEKDRTKIKNRVAESLEAVGFTMEHAQRFPHEFSGGQRQRIGIARALMVHPQVLICDEPVSALDVSIQAQVLNLLRGLQRDRGLTYLFISHDMSVVRYLADRVGVMYKGQLVEENDAQALYEHPQHEYTQKLLSSVPIRHPRERQERVEKHHETAHRPASPPRKE